MWKCGCVAVWVCVRSIAICQWKRILSHLLVTYQKEIYSNWTIHLFGVALVPFRSYFLFVSLIFGSISFTFHARFLRLPYENRFRWHSESSFGCCCCVKVCSFSISCVCSPIWANHSGHLYLKFIYCIFTWLAPTRTHTSTIKWYSSSSVTKCVF